jgi:NAD(P)-dependent dehydrogenase (short-subunit alcohol dehydrogenase family)
MAGNGRLTDKVAVVTGATSGFGEAISRLFAAEGASLVLSGRRADRGEALAAELNASFVGGDVGAEETADALAGCAREAFGRIDALVLNAGIGYPGVGPFWEVKPEEFDLVFRTNVRGVWLCARAAVPLLRPGASVLVMGSMESFVVFPGETVYAATKGAALMLARGMAGDLAARGVRVNCLCPGICDTPLTRWFIENSSDPAATEAEFHAYAPLGRMGTPEEIARAALFLASDESSYCTGASLMADGGVTIR